MSGSVDADFREDWLGAERGRAIDRRERSFRAGGRQSATLLEAVPPDLKAQRNREDGAIFCVGAAQI
jgi:uncharacterized protein YndB with AHSA1/START domain